ncbi:MAG: PadR family transcriptional regulator [Nitrososphaerota archaeon]|nr:PadR family transcriptional regulator [Nitrososphaerota archaeon]MDG7019914.1 PadR family transcriptional regulator [Nitrososphaerota archaeon]MDG7027631.1 PadR family transcriptional regulator [Nitrososphaerota archaeon]
MTSTMPAGRDPQYPAARGSPLRFDGGSLLTDFSRFYVLLLLYEGGKHGYEIMSSIEQRLGRTASPGMVYPFLRLLEGQGYVSRKSVNVGRKARKVYSLTQQGRAFCDRLFGQFAGIVSSAIEPTLQVCAHCGCRVYKDAHLEKVGGKELAFCCKSCASTYVRETGRAM